MKNYVLSIDAGTTSSRAVLFDKFGNQCAIAQHEFKQFFPKEGWVEHDPIEIWETQLKAIKDVIKLGNIQVEEIDSIGITNQRETTVIWDKKTGKPIFNAIVWQDRRTANICENLKKIGKDKIFQKKTGLILDAYFSGTKIKWILDLDTNFRKKAENGDIIFGTIDTWLIWNLTSGKVHVTDTSNASRTLLYNIHEKKWDEELLKILEVPKAMLPNVSNSSEIIGRTNKSHLGYEISIGGIAGDQQAALFGQMCINPGDVKNTYGTGCFCIMNTGKKPVISKNKMLTTIAWTIKNETTYAIEGSVFIAGALVQWLRDQLNIVKSAPEIEQLAKTVKNNGGVTFIPALSGLGAPFWDPHATGAIMGITRGTKKGHIARAALESIALRSRDIILEMEKDANTKFHSLKVDGGASKNNLLMQIQADLLKTKVIRPKITETTALGAAFFSGLSTEFWPSINSINDIWEEDQSFVPKLSDSKSNIISMWEKRVLKVLS